MKKFLSEADRAELQARLKKEKQGNRSTCVNETIASANCQEITKEPIDDKS
jgi:hypothetical protein